MSNKLLKHLPDYYRKSNVMTNVTDTQNEEVDEFIKRVENTLNQFFPDTADFTLERWERELGIPVNKNKSIDYRRNVVKAKIRGSGTFTKDEAISLANTYSREKKSEFTLKKNEYAFKTKYSIDDLIDFEGLRKAFEEMKPAHLLHIVGLWESLDISPDMKKSEILRIIASTPLDNDTIFDHVYRYRLKAEVLGYGIFNPNTIKGLYLNGAWKLDGSRSLDGVNHEDILLYLKQSDNLSTKLKKQVDANLKMDTDIELNLKLSEDQDYKATTTKKELIKKTVDTLCFTEHNPPTIEGLYLNGTWRLDGGKKLDGVNTEGIRLYNSTADILTVKVIKEGEIQEIAVIDY